ncbi:GNAT family N-acetyltransferase [Akkermansiaceae bacterium]|nr:GNAT family N-acetyltransferase [Akkermansiaceae bacterium]
MGIPPFYKEKLVSCPRCLSFLIVPAETGGLAGEPSLRFETARLQFRPAEPRDWRAWHEIHADSRNYDFEISDPVGVSESRKYLKASRYPRGFLKSKRLVFLATNEDGLVLGNVTVTFTQPYLTAVLGIMFHHDHQGRGYGAEAVGAVCDWLTRILGVEKVSAMCDSKLKESWRNFSIIPNAVGWIPRCMPFFVRVNYWSGLLRSGFCCFRR